VGIGYGGASYSYLLAPGFWLAGPSTFVMDVFAYCHGLVLLGTGYVVACWPCRRSTWPSGA